AEEIAPLRLLIVAADGPLNRLPFALLQDERGRYLAERVSVAAVGSLALLHGLRTTVPAKREGMLLVDVQQFEDAVWVPASYRGQLTARRLAALVPQRRLNDLEGTRAEGEQLELLFGKVVRRLSNAAAQEAE